MWYKPSALKKKIEYFGRVVNVGHEKIMLEAGKVAFITRQKNGILKGPSKLCPIFRSVE